MTREKQVTDENGLQAWLYDVSGDDAPTRISDLDPTRINDGQILWIDANIKEADAASVLKVLGIEGQLDLDTVTMRPGLVAHEGFHRRLDADMCYEKAKVGEFEVGRLQYRARAFDEVPAHRGKATR